MELKHPGVFIEHVPSGLLAVEAASTAVAAFIGPVKRGQLVTDDKEDGEPVFISTQSQYAAQFGTLDGAAGGLRNLGTSPDDFGWAVQSYFLNGGTKAYIVPVGDGNGDAATTVLGDPSDPAAGLQFTASSAGVWANGMAIRMSLVLPDADPKKALYDVAIGLLNEKQKLDPILETHTGMVMDSTAGQYLVDKINSSSSLVSVAAGPRGSFAGSAVVGVEGTPASGFDPSSIAAGKTLDVTITGDSVASPITVTFAGGAATLAALANEIETQVKAGTSAPARTGLRAVATPEGSILILPGRSTNTAIVNTVTITGGNVRAALGFSSPTVIGVPPFVTSTASPVVVTMADGTDHGDPGNDDYSKALEHLRDYRDITILILPGRVWTPGGDNGALDAAVTHAEFMQNRMVLIDPPRPEGTARLQSPKDVKDMGAPNSPYTALYYPWLDVANPFYDPDTAANLPKSFRIPPGPFAAGLWARIDGRRGVWKAPAGLEATVRGALGPNIDIGADLQDNLNEYGVNCLRSIIGPTVVWGARTLATKTQPEFRYVPIRRTQNMIGESLYNALQAVVFEPNDEKLWASLRAGAGAFMESLHRAGAFQPEKASDAYYVRCGLNVTMTQGDIDAGIVRLVVGFAPLKPAEFVVVQIKQIVGQTA
jgi:hypothetical protein